MNFSALKKLVLALTLVAGPLISQSIQPIMQVPECTLYFSLTAGTLNSGNFDNRFSGCSVWTVVYTNSGYTALTLTVQSAPDAAGAPGAWVPFAGNVLVGVNPNTALTQNRTVLYGYYPWMRVNLGGTVGAGTVRGTLYGFKDRSTLAIVIAGGGTGGVPTYCPNSAAFNLAGAGTTQIIAAVAGQTVRICHISMAMNIPSATTIVRGTGANCAVGTAAMSGVYQNVTAMALDFAESPLVGVLANAVCITQGAAATTGGLVTYAQY